MKNRKALLKIGFALIVALFLYFLYELLTSGLLATILGNTLYLGGTVLFIIPFVIFFTIKYVKYVFSKEQITFAQFFWSVVSPFIGILKFIFWNFGLGLLLYTTSIYQFSFPRIADIDLIYKIILMVISGGWFLWTYDFIKSFFSKTTDIKQLQGNQKTGIKKWLGLNFKETKVHFNDGVSNQRIGTNQGVSRFFFKDDGKSKSQASKKEKPKKKRTKRYIPLLFNVFWFLGIGILVTMNFIPSGPTRKEETLIIAMFFLLIGSISIELLKLLFTKNEKIVSNFSFKLVLERLFFSMLRGVVLSVWFVLGIATFMTFFGTVYEQFFGYPLNFIMSFLWIIFTVFQFKKRVYPNLFKDTKKGINKTVDAATTVATKASSEVMKVYEPVAKKTKHIVDEVKREMEEDNKRRRRKEELDLAKKMGMDVSILRLPAESKEFNFLDWKLKIQELEIESRNFKISD